MSEWYDKRATPREFQVGSPAMVLLPGKSRVTESRFEGPYQVLRRLGPVTYEIGKPDRPRKKQVCHVDRLKPFFPEEGGAAEQNGTMSQDPQQKMILCMQVDQELPEEEEKWSRADGTRLSNSESLAKIEEKLQHLEGQQSVDLTNLLRENASLFTDVPRRHKSVTHEVEVRDARPDKQSAYRLSPEKRELMRMEVEYLLKNDLAEPSSISGEEVRVFTLQPDIWEPPRDDVYIRFNLSNQQVATNVTDFTVCSRVFPTAITTLQVLLSYATADDFSNAIMMYIIDNTHFFRYNNKPQPAIESLNLGTLLRQWRHYCHVFSGDTYTMYVDGAALASGSIVVDDRVIPLNGTFVVGQEQDELSRKFQREQILKGYVTQLNFWNYGLSKADIEMAATCKENLKGNIFSSDRDSFELINSATNIWPLLDLCSQNEDFLIIPEGHTFEESVKICRKIGSSIFAPLTRNIRDKVNKTLYGEDICAKYLWIGITDEKQEGIWRRVSDDAVVTDIFWGPGQPDNTPQENCILMDGRDAQWNDYSCKEYKACTPCQDPLRSPMFFRGICKERVTEIMFEILGYYRSKPYFHGFYGLMIIQPIDKQWLLTDTVLNVSLASLTVASDTVYPLGRHHWTLLKPMCEQAVGTTRELTLSICKKGQYMCNDGECIDLAARCDAKSDCGDETDEDSCSILQVPQGYRSFKPPKNLEDPSQPLQPYFKFQFLRFLKIEDVEETINLEFIVSIHWRDSRLTYTNLRDDIHANKLSDKETDSIWQPKLKFPNVKDGKLDKLEELLYIQKEGNPRTEDFNSVNMDVVHEGDAALIIQQQHYSGSFACDFDVFYYPFDVQRCSVLVQLSSANEELVSFTTEKSTVEFDENAKFGTYFIHEFVTQRQKSKTAESLFKVCCALQD
ncbi:uncharacterized protein [Procambarus clarkii]|uniref:uncharacterized protein n=1 Tax=Procambarus clarkii TaxID=6728 RepID=UPI0037431BA1